MSKKQLSQAKEYSLKLISQYSRTIFEISEKLKSKGCSQKIINQTIEFLKKNDYLNDKTYIQQWLDFQLKNRPCGKILCYNKLTQKRLPTKLIQQILDQKYPEEKELAITKMLAEKKLKIINSKNKIKILKKLNNHLNNKGITGSVKMQYFENSGYLY